jgi:DNA primase catalytic core
MPRIADSSKEKVREAVDIVDLINHYTDLRRNGSQYMGRCPFHEDNSPSFSVNPTDKVYYCFGCQVKGDPFTFVQEKEGLDFAGSIEYLAEQFNVELVYEELDPRAQERQKARERLYELLERATKFYERTLADAPEAEAAREYLKSRGFSPEVLAKFRVGYSPKAWDKLFVPALRQGFTEQELQEAGLVQKNDRGQIFDRFRGRIMFPLADKKGIVRGFGARGMRDSDKPKYLNSAEGPVYHKGSQIFAIDHARRPAASKKRVIAVEGYADVLALHDAGFEESVAVMGTAMTEQQATELARMAPRVYLALDADASGRKAALRAAEASTAIPKLWSSKSRRARTRTSCSRGEGPKHSRRRSPPPSRSPNSPSDRSSWKATSRTPASANMSSTSWSSSSARWPLVRSKKNSSAWLPIAWGSPKQSCASQSANAPRQRPVSAKSRPGSKHPRRSVNRSKRTPESALSASSWPSASPMHQLVQISSQNCKMRTFLPH